jgi:hypothetical protein
VPDCAAVRRLASRGSAVAAVVRDDPLLTLPVPAGAQSLRVALPRRDRYSFWLAGSTRDRVDVIVDGRSVGGADGQLNNRGQYVELARAKLPAGSHTVGLRFERNRLRPGTGGPDYGFGPLVIAPTDSRRRLVVVPSAQAGRLCRRKLDWVEAVG